MPARPKPAGASSPREAAASSPAPPSPTALPPEGLPEIAFVGRSNVGKSSLVNALTGRRTLARISQHARAHAPDQFLRSRRPADAGRSARLWLCRGVESRDRRAGPAWSRHYLRRPRQLCAGVCLLIDARHGIKEADRPLMRMLDEAGGVLSDRADQDRQGRRRTSSPSVRRAIAAELATPCRGASRDPSDERARSPRHRRIARDSGQFCVSRRTIAIECAAR